ncbi:MAG: hypothetical protein JXA20_00845 [Spirochaetes bacterium]|nr:hypothetical protein [Spirochaetota bacterium]
METLIENIHQMIKQSNSMDSIDAIPHSDIFAKSVEVEMGIERHEASRIVNILKEAHKIFFIEVLKEDKAKDVKRIVGFVDANLETIQRLRSFFQNRLVEEYQAMFKRKLPVTNILKELLMKPASFKNTLLGQIANKAMMLEEYENLMVKESYQYTDQWKKEKQNEIIHQMKEEEQRVAAAHGEVREAPKGPVANVNRRAVDSDQYKEFAKTSQNQSAATILKIYGIDFFVRVNLRKYNFKLLADLVEKGEFRRRDDLKLMRGMLQRVKSNIGVDSKLEEYRDEIARLEKTLLTHLISGK